MSGDVNLSREVKKAVYPCLFLLFLFLSFLLFRLEQVGESNNVLSIISGAISAYFFIKWIILAAKHGIWQR